VKPLKNSLLLALVFGLTSTHVATDAASQGQHRIILCAYVTTKAPGKLDVYISGISKKLDARAVEALAKIDDTGHRLLALRGYLRSERSLASKWSWSADQIELYKQSAEYRDAIAEVDNVRKKFETLNPGYTLHVNTEVRSLEAQIKSWNEAKSVKVAAEDLVTAAGMEISNSVYKDLPDQPSLMRFERFLKNHSVVSTPTVAVPGLSPHGQLRAFDFQIKQGDKIIAGTNTAMIKDVWDGQGWTEKLRTAVTAASRKFIGPLASPREPWHYTYSP
jgi:hypothetical protein